MVPTRKCSGALAKERLTKERFWRNWDYSVRIENLPKDLQLLPNQALHGIARLRAWFQTKKRLSLRSKMKMTALSI